MDKSIIFIGSIVVLAIVVMFIFKQTLKKDIKK